MPLDAKWPGLLLPRLRESSLLELLKTNTSNSSESINILIRFFFSKIYLLLSHFGLLQLDLGRVCNILVYLIMINKRYIILGHIQNN